MSPSRCPTPPSTSTSTTSTSTSTRRPHLSLPLSQDTISRAILSASTHSPKAITIDTTTTHPTSPSTPSYHTEGKSPLDWEFPLPPPPPPSPVEMRRFWA
ncbi:hypothetical protein M752DRAFT_274202 [Aspergillus phoenicis ATCC 13157]|uniref:Uncharacterized protein n=1 Tax=Aspergillus phoenicis ATCC 13157 TaxID=1353007 RepID=A0A370PRV8_ASPPH|nr:hypothetical protein M752DRAFT_274202 [Aspergillus phoenicis ATCC 13157]